MKMTKMVIAITVVGALCVGRIQAQDDFDSVAAVGSYNDSTYDGTYEDKKTGEGSPSDQPAPSVDVVVPGGDCGGCGSKWCGECNPLDCPELDPCRLFDNSCRSFNIYGWADAGATVNGRNTPDNYNGPLTFNDRNDFQFNQLYLVMEKELQDDSCGWQFGGRADVLWGSDARFTKARGLETRRDFSDRWNSERFQQLSLPQLYAEIGYNDWRIKLGHFYTIIGYEVVTAPDNFFYSHAYTMQYGEPFTHTGLLASKPVGDQWVVHAGFTRGWDNWDDNPGTNQVDVLGGATWTSCDERTSVALSIVSGEEDRGTGILAPRTMYSVVLSHQINSRLTYILQHDNGWQDFGAAGNTEDAEWYGFNQYLLYKINCCWEAGVRFEWFRDDDGTRVAGIGDGNLAVGPFEGDFYEVTWGLNYKPNDNIVIRPELRYDWFDGTGLPYNGASDSDMFTAAFDVILHF